MARTAKSRRGLRDRPYRRRAAAPAAVLPVAVDPVPRINELIKAARTSWFGLLSYLAFVGVTLVGVTHADFFITEHQTDLPLIGVSVPTALFFAIAPGLGVMVHTYLHLYLLKLWEELAKANADIEDDKLGDEIDPWLVADYALTFRPDSPVRPRPMRLLSNLVSMVLIFIAAPLVLGWFWWRSMPRHDEVLTVVWCGVPLLIATYASATSWVRLRRLAVKRPDGPIWRIPGWSGWTLLWLAVSLFGFMRTEGTLADYARNWGITQSVISKEHGSLKGVIPTLMVLALDSNELFYDLNRAAEEFVGTRWWMKTDFLTVAQADFLAHLWRGLRLPAVLLPTSADPVRHILAPAELDGVALVEVPADWRVRDEAEQAFRNDWCKAEGLAPEICGNGPFAEADPTLSFIFDPDQDLSISEPYLLAQRLHWCKTTFYPDGGAPDAATLQRECDDHFTGIEGGYRRTWQSTRDTTVKALPRRDLRRADLRAADLSGARLEGADLSGARLEGAVLWRARMEGAVLSFARMEGAFLREARMEGAFLGSARMEGADLSGARMEGADLSGARLEGADLSEARMEGADLSEARMEGADLRGARMEGADLRWARLEGADLRDAQMAGADLRGARLEGANLSGARLEGAVLSGATFDAATSLTDALFQAASVREVDFSLVSISPDQVNSMFGDGSVILPGGKGITDPEWPKHWPRRVAGIFGFQTEWRAWQKRIGYTPPP